MGQTRFQTRFGAPVIPDLAPSRTVDAAHLGARTAVIAKQLAGAIDATHRGAN